jgi:hypothetical protein
MFSVPDGRAADHSVAATTFKPSIEASSPGARVSFADDILARQWGDFHILCEFCELSSWPGTQNLAHIGPISQYLQHRAVDVELNYTDRAGWHFDAIAISSYIDSQ